MSLKKLLCTLLVLCLFPVAGQAELPKLTVHITGIDPAEGNLEVSLFDSAENFLKQPWSQKAGTIAEDGSSTVSFAALAEGEYAVVVVHDANGNNKLDNGFLGFGAENVQGVMVAGLGAGGEGHTSFTIASPTGEGITNPISFSRIRRCVLKDSFRIV